MITREQWAISLLKWLGAPLTGRNRRALVAWVSAEGTMARWNPLATTQPMPGSTDWNTTHVQEFVSWEQGLEATVKTLHYGDHGYDRILKHLYSNSRPRRTLRAVEDSDWGTGGLALKVLRSMRGDRYDQFADQPIGT